MGFVLVGLGLILRELGVLRPGMVMRVKGLRIRKALYMLKAVFLV